MRILILSNSDEGIYRFRKELLTTLIHDNNEVFVCVFNGKYVEKIKDIGCEYIPIDFNRKGTNPIKDLQLLNKYTKIIDTIKPDAVLTYTIKPNVYGGLACQVKKVPYFSTITGLGSAIENGGILQKISLFLYKIGSRRVNKMFFQNETNRDFMIKQNIISKDSSILVPGSGVNLDEYKYQKYPDDKTIGFAYIGRIMKQKGFDQYVDTAKYITNKYPNTIFHVCGTYEDDYKQLVEDLNEKGIIKYHGNVEDMVNEIYKNIHCTIHPSYYAEGMSNVLLESCASGKAIITTNRPGCKEIVEDDYNGYIVLEKDSDDLINKVEKYLSLTSSQRKKMSKNARKYVETKFDRKIVIDKYIEALKNI